MGLLLPTRGRETTSSSSGSIFSHCRQRTAAARAPPLVEFSSNTRADELCAPAAHTHTTAERDKSYPPVMRGMFVGGRCGSCFGGLSRRPPFRQIKDKLLRLLRRRLPSLLLPSIPSLARLRSAWLVQAAKGRGVPPRSKYLQRAVGFKNICNSQLGTSAALFRPLGLPQAACSSRFRSQRESPTFVCLLATPSLGSWLSFSVCVVVCLFGTAESAGGMNCASAVYGGGRRRHVGPPAMWRRSAVVCWRVYAGAIFVFRNVLSRNACAAAGVEGCCSFSCRALLRENSGVWVFGRDVAGTRRETFVVCGIGSYRITAEVFFLFFLSLSSSVQ